MTSEAKNTAKSQARRSRKATEVAVSTSLFCSFPISDYYVKYFVLKTIEIKEDNINHAISSSVGVSILLNSLDIFHQFVSHLYIPVIL